MKPTSEQEWKKVIWEESPDVVRVSQGLISYEDGFIRIKGDVKEVLIRKDKIVSIQGASKQDDRRII